MRNVSAFQPNGLKQIQLADTSLFSDANLVSYWKLDGNSTDTKGVANGTDTNITYSTAKFGQGAGPTGTSAPDITVSNAAFNVTTGNASWSFLVKSSSYPSTDSFTPFFLGGGYAVSGYYAEILNDGSIQFISNQAAAIQSVKSSTGVITTNTWYHCVFVKTGTTIDIYVNGVNVKTGTITNPASGGNNLVLLNYGPDKKYRGPAVIDDFAFFSRALSAGEIQQLYYSGSTKAYYPLNGNSTDYSGNANHGTETAITYPQGRFGQGAKFNGSSSKIEIANNSTLNPTNITVMAWVKTTSVTNKYVVSKLHTGTPFSGYAMAINTVGTGGTDNEKYLAAWVGDNTNGWVNFEVGKISDNKFHLIGFSYDGTSVRLFFDGVQKTVANRTASLTHTSNLFIGFNQFATTYFDGMIDEVIIESRAWTAKEVETYYRKSTLNYGRKTWAQMLLSILALDTITTSETFTSIRSRLSSTIDTITTSETVSAVKALILNVIDTVVTSEVVTKTMSFVSSVIDTIVTSEPVTLVRRKWEEITKNSSTWTPRDESSSSTWTETDKSE